LDEESWIEFGEGMGFAFDDDDDDDDEGEGDARDPILMLLAT